MQVLYSWGLVGCGLHAAGLYSIARTLVRISRSGSHDARYGLPLLIAMIAFSAGSATSSYLLTLDALFAIFLPVTVVKLYLLEGRQLLRSGRSRRAESPAAV